MRGDFLNVLKEHGYAWGPVVGDGRTVDPGTIAHGTTVLAMKYRDGVLVAGDRRATAGNLVMHDRTDKVLDLDRHSVLAIAGVPATAFEMARVLDHSFKYYRRSQLQELSLDGKLRALSTLLRNNVPMAVQGIGAVAPIFAGYDLATGSGKIFFYDILGAEFEGVEYAASGSGSPTIRGIMYYLHRWGPQVIAQLDATDATVLVLRLLESAAEFDSATGGIKKGDDLYPVVKLVTSEGIAPVPAEHLQRLYAEHVENRRV
jgi:proteasome beta subunit